MTVLFACLVGMLATAVSANGAFPGRNGRIAFVFEPNPFNWEINTILPDGRERRAPYRNSCVSTRSPAYSAEGAQIAWAENCGRDVPPIRVATADFTTIGAAGFDEQGRFLPFADHPSWFPGSNRLAFDDGTSIWIDDLTTRVGARIGEGTSPAVSPNGLKIAFDGLGVMNANGRDRRLLGVPGQHPDWSPSGEQLVFDYLGNIWVVNANGSLPIQLTSRGRDSNPVWSPDGTQIAFTRCCDFGWNVQQEIFVMNRDGTNAHRLTFDPGFPDFPGYKSVGSYDPTWRPIRL